MTYGCCAAYLGHFDFIYCVPEAYLSVPFTFLGMRLVVPLFMVSLRVVC